AETKLSGGAALRVAPLGDVRQWGDALARAGFALPVADEMRVTVRYGSLSALFADLAALGWRGALAQRTPAPKRLFAEAEAIYRERYGSQDGKLPATFVFAFLSGWAPDKSQQQPARRGSGKVSLAEALKAIETD
ncbi:MAG: SAM-dependent methyltransferase, partial [Pseudomonadota bacterium]